MNYADLEEVGPFAFESVLDKDGELEISWEDDYGEIENTYLSKEQALRIIEILSQRFNLEDDSNAG